MRSLLNATLTLLLIAPAAMAQKGGTQGPPAGGSEAEENTETTLAPATEAESATRADTPPSPDTAASGAASTEAGTAKAGPSRPPAAKVEVSAGSGPETEPPPPPARPNPVSRAGPESDANDWRFDYHGYLRAPFRVGMGSRTNRYCIPPGEAWQTGAPRLDPADDTTPNPAAYSCPSTDATPEQRGTTFHRPVVPDDQYLSWQYSGHQQTDWAELFLSVGNDIVTGTVALQAFQFTDGSWSNSDAQFGIGQGWIEFNSDFGYENILFNAKAGSFWSRYGMAGKWDAGEYDTYLFGRTHVLGASGRLDFGVTDETWLGFEVGLGGRRPDPSIYNRARFTMLAHGHLFFNWFDDIEIGAHLLHSFTASETPIMADEAIGADERPNGTDPLFADDNTDDYTPDGSLMVYGADFRMDLGLAGYLYFGGSQIRAKYAYTVAPAIEVLHSFGGGEFHNGVVDNYLESPYCNPAGNQGGACSNGTGTVSSALMQYETALSNFGLFEGDQDLRIKLFGMFNYITADDGDEDWPSTNLTDEDQRQDGTYKLKFGGDLEFFLVPWMSAGVRGDRLQPHSKVPEQSFTVISPRITFRSRMVTREAVSFIYTRYLYEQRECRFGSPADDPFRDGGSMYAGSPPTLYNVTRADDAPGRIFCVQPPPGPSIPDGFGSHGSNQASDQRGAPTLRPDINTFQIQATMWW